MPPNSQHQQADTSVTGEEQLAGLCDALLAVVLQAKALFPIENASEFKSSLTERCRLNQTIRVETREDLQTSQEFFEGQAIQCKQLRDALSNARSNLKKRLAARKSKEQAAQRAGSEKKKIWCEANASSVLKRFEGLTAEQAGGLHKKVSIAQATVSAGQLIYVPPGWLCALTCCNGGGRGASSGVRWSALPSSDNTRTSMSELYRLLQADSASSETLRTVAAGDTLTASRLKTKQ